MPVSNVLTKQNIEQIYDGSASIYDRIGPSIFAGFARRLVQDIQITVGMRVLDVATGTGAVLVEEARRVGLEGHVIGIDLSAVILAEAKQVVESNALENVELRKMDAEHLEFPDGSFDVVTCAFALFMFPDIEAALREMYRVCKPGGYVGVTYFAKSPLPFDPGWPLFAQQCKELGIGMRMPQQIGTTPQDLESLLNRCGFQTFRTQTEVYDLVYATEDDWWGFMMMHGTRATLLGMDEGARAKLKKDHLARLRPALRVDGFHMSTGVIYSVARRN